MKTVNKKMSPEIILTVFRRFHLTIFVVLFVSGLSLAVIMLTNIFNSSSPDSTNSQTASQNSSSNQEVADKILQQENIPPYTLPDGRINPFSE